MTRLQKTPPSANASGLPPLQSAVPYENLPQSTQQPVPVISNSYNELPSTNPFSPNFAPQPSPSSNAQLFSPVSPIAEPRPFERSPQPALHAPEPQRLNGNRNHADIQRLPGKSHPSNNHAEKGPKHVKVAKDMFDGALPPMYQRQASDPFRSGPVAPALSNAQECDSCGKKRTEGVGCDCGKPRSNGPASRAPNTTNHSRTTSTGVNSERSVASSSTAVQSTSSSSAHHHSCNKCGRHRRPGSLGTPNVSATSPTQPTPDIRLQRAGLAIQPNATATHNPIYPQIDIIPPSATTYRRTNTVPSPFTPYGEESPLVTNPAQPQSPPKKPDSRGGFRNNSIVRSLSRRLSRREKEKDKSTAPLPSQQLAAGENQTGEQSAGRLINMISSAMQEPSHGRDHQYAKIEVQEPERPGSPFSFIGERDESDTFKKEAGLESNAEYLPNQEDRLDVIPRPKSADPHHGRHLSPGDAERPQITRFKSLRVGVNRVNQSISRSQSLKRMGSVKQAHHAWYVDGSDENSLPVF